MIVVDDFGRAQLNMDIGNSIAIINTIVAVTLFRYILSKVEENVIQTIERMFRVTLLEKF